MIFLDADDALLPEALETCVPLFDDPQVAKVHWPLRIMDKRGGANGCVCHSSLPAGDLRAKAFALGPSNIASPPTSGNAWARSYLEQVFPVPEDVFRICADMYLFECAPFFGQLRALKQPLSLYRTHGENFYGSLDWNAKRRRAMHGYETIALRLLRHCHSIGIPADLNAWRRNS